MWISSTLLLVIMVTGALIASMATMNLQQAFGINRSTQTTFQDSSGCDPGSTCNNAASTSINFVGRSNNNVASEDITSRNNLCQVGSTCSNDASQSLVINGDGNRATLRTSQVNSCYHTPGSNCSNDADFSVGISGNNNQMDGDFNQFNGCRVSSTCTNEVSFISDLPPGNSGSFSITVKQRNGCSFGSICTNDANNSPSSEYSQTNYCQVASTCTNSGTNNLNDCFNGAVCTNTGDSPSFPNNGGSNRCLNGAVCFNSGQRTNIVATGATATDPPCTSGPPGSTTYCEPGQPPIVRP